MERRFYQRSFTKGVFSGSQSGLLPIFAVICFAPALFGQTWNGGGTNNNWSTATNWVGNSAPANNGTAVLIFGGTTRLAPNADAAWDVSGIQFTNDAGVFVIGGSALTIRGNGVTNNDADLQTINNTITLAAAQTWNANNGSLLFSGSITNGGNLLTIGGAQNTTLSGIVRGTGGLTKTDGGTLTLSAVNTFSGATTISGGVVNAQNTSAFGTTAGGVTVSSGAALELQGGIAVGAEALTLNGSGISSGGALRNVSGNNSWAGAVTLGSATTIASDSGTLTMSGAFANGGYLATFSGVSNTTLSGVISGTGGLTKNDGGTLTLSGSSDNTFSGTTTVNDGVLALNKTVAIDAIAGSLIVGDDTGAGSSSIVRLLADNQISDTAAVTVNTDGLLDWNGNDDKIGALTLYLGDNSSASITTGAGKIHTTGTITVAVKAGTTGAVGATLSGNMVDGGAVRTIDVGDGAADADLTISAVVAGNNGYVKEGAGRLVLTGVNTAGGAFTVNNGQLQIQNASALGDSTASTINTGGALELVGGISFDAEALTLNGSGVDGTGALLNVSGNNTWSGGLTIGSATTFGSSSGTLTISDTFANAGFLLTATGAGDLTFSGVISGTGGFTKNGAGMLTLSGSAANTFSDVTTVNEGTLLLNKTATKNAIAGTLTVGDASGGANADVVRWNADNQMPAVAVTVNNSGWLDLNGHSDAIGSLTMTGGTVSSGVGTLTLGGNITGNADASTASISGNLALGANRTFTIADGAADTDMQISAVVSGAFTLTKDGAGTLLLSGANTYTGATTVSNGVVNIQNSSALGTTAGATTVKSGGELQVQGGISVGAEALTLNGSGVASGGALRNISGNNSWTGIVNLASASTIASDAGTLTLVGNITNGGFLPTITGAGNVTASGVISGTGALTKSGSGTLTLNGTNTFSGAVTIDGGTVAINNVASLGVTNIAATINAGTLLATETITGSRNFTLGSASSTIEVDATKTFTVNGVMSGTGGLVKTGNGTLLVGGSNTFTGNLSVNAGTLMLGANNRIGDSVAVSLSGGVLDSGGYNETVGALTLTADSIIDFGSATSAVHFANSASASWTAGTTLTITNWNGTWFTGGGTDQIFFGSDSTGLSGGQLAQIRFADPNGYYTQAAILSNGEVVPVPEPATIAAIILLLGLVCGHERKRILQWIRRRSMMRFNQQRA